MVVLGIDTSGPVVAAALLRDGRVACAREATGGRQGARRLADLLDGLTAEAGGPSSGLDGVAATLGPGPYTALRVGLGTAAGVALAAGCGVSGVPTAEALEEVASPGAGGLLVLLDAGRGEIWVPGDVPRAGRLVTPEVLAAELVGGQPPALLVGPGAERHRSRLESLLGDTAVGRLPPAAGAIGAAIAGARRLKDGRALPLRPLYPRPPDVVPPGGVS